MPTSIVLLSVAEPVIVEEATAEVLARLTQPDPGFVEFTRIGGKAVHVRRDAVALVEEAAEQSGAEPSFSTTTTAVASTSHEEPKLSTTLSS